jgi:heptose I phosphotransferase
MTEEVILRPPFNRLWSRRDPFAAVEALQGQVLRELDGRRTLRFEIEGRGYFVKIHHGVGWGEIFKNLSCLRLPVLGARNEFLAIERLTRLGVGTMRMVAFGERGWNPARRRSFIITEELAPTISLEDFCRDWSRTPPELALKRALITRVAEMARKMHSGGMNHRDFYLCHFLLHTQPPPRPDALRLSIIDLHRARINTTTAPRWRRKDLAGLYFSALDIGLTRRDLLRFIRVYFDAPLRTTLAREAGLLKWLQREAVRLVKRYQRKFASEAPGGAAMPRATNGWRLLPPYNSGETAHAFASLDAVFNLAGEALTYDRLSNVLRVTVEGVVYYVKRYRSPGKNPLRRWFGRSRVQAEWENLLAFADWGLPTAQVVGYGLERRAGAFVRGALITRELVGTVDFARLAEENDPRLRSHAWLAVVVPQVAHIARTLHNHRFAHNDFKWRNLLVDAAATLHLIDCPGGQCWPEPFLSYRIVKDLACLDKLGKYNLSRTWRMRFFRAYRGYSGHKHLTAADKSMIRRILRFFEGRE